MVRFRSMVVVFFLLAGCGAPSVYTREDMTRLGAKEVTGVVVKPSLGSFVLVVDGGEETIFRTGQLTQYIPPDYRSLQGDRVRVAYQEIMERSGRAKLAVLQLEALDIPAGNLPAPSPVTGVVVYADTQSWVHVRPEGSAADAPPLLLKGRTDSVVKTKGGGGISSLALGTRVTVEFERLPVVRGNGYYYKIKTLTEL